MNSKLSNALFFTVGAAIGSFIAWRLVEIKYRRISSEEINEIREYYANKEQYNNILASKKYKTLDEVCGDVDISEKDRVYTANKIDVTEEEKLEVVDLDEYESFDEFEEEGEGEGCDDGPRVISPAEFAVVDDYDAVSLVYYRDGILADDWGNIIKNADEIVGSDFASHFGQYEDDTVYVRNSELKTDYEINRDLRTYTSANERPPHMVDDQCM